MAQSTLSSQGDRGRYALKARSLVFDLFGDYLRYRGGEVRLRSLVTLLGVFEVPETTIRVVVARLRKEGWLESRRAGRETAYVLSEAGWALLDEGRERIFERAVGPWDGHWHMVIYSVSETDRALREQLRKKLAWLGYGPLSASVYVSPHDRVTRLGEQFLSSDAVQLDHFRACSAGAEADRDIARRAWDLEALNRDYGVFLERYEPRLAAYRTDRFSGPDALVERTQLVNDYRHFPFRDPDLPPELLPSGWRGRRAHEVFLEAHGSLRRPAEEFVDLVVNGEADETVSLMPDAG